MKKGSSLPLVLIVVAFLLIPLGFWFYYSNSNEDNVKGAKISGVNSGFFVTVDSKGATWDLMAYLCKDKTACLASPTAGFQLETISGGKVKNYQVTYSYQDSWDQYSYLKIYAKSGWGSQARNFSVVKLGSVPGSAMQKVTDGVTFDMVIFPLKEIKSSFFEAAEFSD